MKIKHDSNESNHLYNKDFLALIDPIILKIFSTVKLGNIDYINSTIKRHELGDHKSPIPLRTLGDNEFLLMRKIMTSSFPTIFVKGGLGAGKTSIVNYLSNHIKTKIICANCAGYDVCQTKSVFAMYFDLSTATVDRGNYVSATLGVYEGFYRALKDQIFLHFGDKDIISAFEDHLMSDSNNQQKNSRRLVGFAEFKYQMLNDKKWAASKPSDKVVKIIKYIEKTSKSIESRLEQLFDLLVIIRLRYPPDTLMGCFFIVIDNLDGLPKETQVAVASFFARLAGRVDIRIIIPVRPSTKGAIIYGSGEIQYDEYIHTPINICDLVEQRIQHFIDNIDDSKSYDTRNLGSGDRKWLLYRAEHILYILKSNTRLRDTLAALTGHSLRRGLHVAERLFINNVYRYDDQKIPKDMYTKALLIHKNMDDNLELNDPLVSNIFMNHTTQHNSLLCIRTLKILLIFKNEKTAPSLRTVINIIQKYQKYDDEVIIENLAHLVIQKKRLIYFSSTIENLMDLSKLDLERYTIELTDAGEKYIDMLSLDLTYVQRCFYSLDWNDTEIKTLIKSIETAKVNHFIMGLTSVPIKKYLTDIFSNGYNINEIPTEVWESFPMEKAERLIDRFTVVRKMLNTFLLMDIFQVLKYLYDNAGPYSQEKYCNEIVINRTISNLALSILNILRGHLTGGDKRIKEAVRTELEDWLSLLIMAKELEMCLLQSDGAGLGTVQKAYNSFLIKNQ